MPRKEFDLKIGSKVQVYRGLAHKTSGGLLKKDIVKVKDSQGVTRYKSKKQQKYKDKPNAKSQKARSDWTESFKKALKELREEDEYYKTHILMSKDKTKKKAYNLYKRTKDIYEG